MTRTVAFGQDDTKTHAPFEIGLPDVLRAPLETYLGQHRPVLMARCGRWTRPVAGALTAWPTIGEACFKSLNCSGGHGQLERAPRRGRTSKTARKVEQRAGERADF